MSSLGSAFNQVATGNFIMSAGLIVVGTWASMMLTDWMRNNVVDIGMTGGDAVYALVGAVLTMGFLPRRFGRPLALGMVASGGQTALREANVI